MPRSSRYVFKYGKQRHWQLSPPLLAVLAAATNGNAADVVLLFSCCCCCCFCCRINNSNCDLLPPIVSANEPESEAIKQKKRIVSNDCVKSFYFLRNV